MSAEQFHGRWGMRVDVYQRNPNRMSAQFGTSTARYTYLRFAGQIWVRSTGYRSVIYVVYFLFCFFCSLTAGILCIYVAIANKE